MSGDVQPRKRNKDKKTPKKKGSFEAQRSFDEKDLLKTKISWCSFDDDLDSDETNIHVHKDIKFGGNLFAKIFFLLVFGGLICMVGVIVFEHRGAGNEVLSDMESPWSQMLEGWLEDKTDAHDSHDDHHVVHDEHDDDEEDHDHDENDHEEDDHEEDDHEEEDAHELDEHEDLEHEHDHEAGDTAEDDEAGIFTGFIRKYIQPSPEEEEDEEGVFTGFINKYIYTTSSAAQQAEEGDKADDEQDRDEGYGSQDDDDDRKDADEQNENDDDNDEQNDDEDEENDNEQENEDKDRRYRAETPRRYKRHSLDEEEKEEDDDDDDDGFPVIIAK
uniref:Uncharacterized protein n=1 Tax=Cacopsylla melanoneura TaxID=428564 RepID=A0A8D9EY48_9HEMI